MVHRKAGKVTIRLLVLLLSLSAAALAQRGTTDVRGTVGWTTFIDESAQGHLFTGAAVRYYVTSRLSVEPEFVYMYKDRTDKDVGFQANVAWDFGRPGSKVVPYVVGGVGVLRTIFKFGGGPSFNTTETMLSGGFGAKIYLGKNLFIAPEGRLGYEPIIRATVSIGYSFR